MHLRLGPLAVAVAALSCATRPPSDPPAAPVRARFAFVPDLTGGSISIFAVEEASGQLRPRGTVPAGARPVAVLLHPSAPVAYAVDNQPGFFPTRGPGSLLAFSMDPATGELSPLPSAPAGMNPVRLILDPQGRFAWVESDDGLQVYTLDGPAGAPVRSLGSPFTAVGAELTVLPGGRMALAVRANPSRLASYALDPATGILALRAESALPAAAAPTLLVGRAGRTAHVLDGQSGAISSFAVDPGSGALTPLPGAVATGTGPVRLLLEPRGEFVYLPNAGSNDVSAWSVGSDGALHPVPGAPFPAGAGPAVIAFDPGGRFLYVTSSGGAAVAGLAIDRRSGALSAIPGSPFDMGGAPVTLTVDPTGASALVTTGPSSFYVTPYTAATIATYSIDSATGALGRLASRRGRRGASGATFTQGETAVTCAPRFAFVADGGSASLSGFRVDPRTGRLTPLPGSPFPVGSQPRGIAADPWGRFLWVSLAGGELAAFRLDAESGTPVPVPGSPFAVQAGDHLAVDPSGRSLWSSGAAGAVVLQVDRSSGAVALASGAPFAGISVTELDPTGSYGYSGATGVGAWRVDGAAPSPVTGSPYGGYAVGGVAAHPEGRFVLATGAYKPWFGVHVLEADPTTGALAEVAGSPFGSGAHGELAVDPLGRFAYAAGAGTVSGWAIDRATGALTEVAGSPFGATAAPSRPAIDVAGRFLYAADAAAGLVAYAIAPATGSLTPLPGFPLAAGSAPGAVALVSSCR
jgi:6-phosphogluconolactonase (cycloisomerase 2 family)